MTNVLRDNVQCVGYIYFFFRLIFSNNNNFGKGKEGGELKFFVGKMES